MINIHCHIDDLDVKILASFANDLIERKRDISDQSLPAIFWREYHVVS